MTSCGTSWSAGSSPRTTSSRLLSRLSLARARGEPPRGRPTCRCGAMTVEINNESGVAVDEAALVRLATFTMDQLRIHPLAELSILLVDEAAMTAYHVKYMGEDGP